MNRGGSVKLSQQPLGLTAAWSKYSLTQVDVSIVDIDECSISSACDHNCHNAEGSYFCSCRPSYTLKADKLTCEGEFSLNHFLSLIFFP